MADDDAAQEEVDGWIRENNAFKAKGAGMSDSDLNARILKRLNGIRKKYEDFIKLHPKHARARIAFASLLDDLGDEEEEVNQLEKARELDPTLPAAYNQLANYYGHRGPVKKAFDYYTRAIELDPTEPVYYENFGTTVYLFRKDAKEYYHINESQVFDKALLLYSNAVRLDPTNFLLATDVAESYYEIKPPRTDDALSAWTNALNVATTEVEREGVYIHMARFQMNDGRFAEARAHLDAVTNASFDSLKKLLVRNLNEKEAAARNTNSPPEKAN